MIAGRPPGRPEERSSLYKMPPSDSTRFEAPPLGRPLPSSYLWALAGDLPLAGTTDCAPPYSPLGKERREGQDREARIATPQFVRIVRQLG